MHTIIGLGSMGGNIAEKFEQKPGFTVKFIDFDIEGDNAYNLGYQASSEEYEESVNPQIEELSKFLSDVTDEIFLIVDGSEHICGATLQVLKLVKDKQISVVYVKPDVGLLNEIGRQQDRVFYNVFQEYARSGVFKKTYIFSLINVEQMLDDIPIAEYNDKITEYVYTCLHTFLNLSKQKAIIDNYNEPKDISRIATLGLYNLESGDEYLMANMQPIDEKCYYFLINENDLKTNGKLFRVIKDKMRAMVQDNTKISYRIHSSEHEQNFCYVVAYTKKVQE